MFPKYICSVSKLFFVDFRNLSHHGSFRSTSSSTMSSVMSSTSFWTKLSNVFQERKEKNREIMKKSWNREKNSTKPAPDKLLNLGDWTHNYSNKKFVRIRHNEAKYFLKSQTYFFYFSTILDFTSFLTTLYD